MSSEPPSTPPSAPVSALRSRFEQLAQQQHSPNIAGKHNVPPASPKHELSPFLTTSEPEGKRHRAVSNGHQDRLPVPPIRPSTSSSDLKTSTKRPPPPPPSPSYRNKTSTDNTVHDASSTRSTPIPELPPMMLAPAPEKQALVARKPPPPPPPSYVATGRRSDEEEPSIELTPSGSVASLRSKFAYVLNLLVHYPSS